MKFISQFGKLPAGKRLERIRQSANYKNGEFQNLSLTEMMTDGATYYSVLKESFTAPKNVKPEGRIPSQKTELLHLKKEEDIMVWFGHSSYFMQLDGKTILVDPVLSGTASPVPYIKAFEGTDAYTTDELPAIDFLFISHDHWDHLDYETILKLQPKVKQVICGLGVGAHLEHWGYKPDSITELDWYDAVQLPDGFKATGTPARHFSGRGLKRSQALWMSYVLRTPNYNIYIGGDSGYDAHFAAIGEKFGPFDLAILENGAYDKSWKTIHMMPAEVVLAAKDLRAKRMIPVHSAKFVLGTHAWDEPLRVITSFNDSAVPLITPMIGERIDMKDSNQKFSKWWEGVK